MKQRVAAKILDRELNFGYGYRKSSIARAARRMRRRKRWSNRRRGYVPAALTATMMRMFHCSIDEVRFSLDGGRFNQRIEALGAGGSQR